MHLPEFRCDAPSRSSAEIPPKPPPVLCPTSGQLQSVLSLYLLSFLPLRVMTIPCIAVAVLLLATQCLSLLSLFFAVAFAFLCSSSPLLIKATPCIHSLCRAAHVRSMQFHCSSEPCFATPLQTPSNQRIAVAAQVTSSPCVAVAERIMSCLCNSIALSQELRRYSGLCHCCATGRYHAEHRSPATHARPSRENRPEERFQTRRSNQRESARC